MVYGYYGTDATLGNLYPCAWFQFEDDSLWGDKCTSNLFYGFPILPWGPPNIARIAVDNAQRMITNPKFRRSNSSALDLDRTLNFVRERCVGTDTQPNFAGTCLMSNVVDNNFVLDFLPPTIKGYDNVAIYTAGWGFKFTPMIGQVLKDLVTNKGTKIDIEHFKITRKGVLKGSSDQSKRKVATYGSQRR